MQHEDKAVATLDKIVATSRNLQHGIFHTTFVAKHVKIIVETSILNCCNIEHLQKIKERDITNFSRQHRKKASTNLATSENLHRNIMGYLLQHGKKHLQILQHSKISIETPRDTYCNMEKRASVAEPRRTATREAPSPQQGSAGPWRATSKPRRFRSSTPGLRCSSPPEKRRGSTEKLVQTKLPMTALHEAPTAARSFPDGAPTAARVELALLPHAGGSPLLARPPATPLAVEGTTTRRLVSGSSGPRSIAPPRELSLLRRRRAPSIRCLSPVASEERGK
jgi:hypothetical protein